MTKYARAFAEAMQTSQISNSTVVDEIGGSITVANVSHWRHGRRPVPAAYAPALARLLNVEPESISQAYENLTRAQAAAGQRVSMPPGHWVLDRLLSFGKTDGRTQLVLPDFLVSPRIGATEQDHIRWTLQPTTSMVPEIPRGTLLLVDVSFSHVDRLMDGGVFAYSLWGRPDVRRVLVRRDGFALTRQSGSANQTFVSFEEKDALEVHGLVLGWIRTNNESEAI